MPKDFDVGRSSRTAADTLAGLRPSAPLNIAVLITLHLLLSAALLWICSSPPRMVVEMSSSVISRAEAYWDIGKGMTEEQSSSMPVRAGNTTQVLTLPLPHAELRGLRFDPLNCPGVFTIRRAVLLRSDGSTALLIKPSLIRGVSGFDQMDLGPNGLRFRVRSDNFDPQLAIDLGGPIDLRSHLPGLALLGRIALVNAILLLFEYALLMWPPGFARASAAGRSMDRAVGAAAQRLSSARFIVFDRLAIWFYIACAVVFVIFTAADVNGSSMAIFWNNYAAGAPARIIAGTPKGIRADEFNYQTPGMLNQYFRAQPFAVSETAAGNHSVGLLAEVPVRDVTTLFRPQFWPFFALPADYAFAAWWQAKWLIMVTGVFTLLLLLTGVSALSMVGALWLVSSQFTQWTFSWPSMLPEMAGLVCFTAVSFLYLCVGTRRAVLALSALICAACAINFALASYVPHQIPYAWVGILICAAWCVGHRKDIFRREGLGRRAAALAGMTALTGLLLLHVFADTRVAVQGIAATVYPGHRSLSGGGYSPATFATHFLGASENADNYPPEYANICESSGFLWLAPLTLLCLGRMRALTRERRILLIGLWCAALLLAGWMVLPIPASIGRFALLDRVQTLRVLPALGFLNVAIVVLVLSVPVKRGWIAAAAIFAITAPAAFLVLTLANGTVVRYFHLPALLTGTLWASVLIALLLTGRRLAFAAAVVIPNVLLFGLVNPVERGIDTITATPLFDLVQRNVELRRGKWLVFSEGYPSSIFTAVGCDVYNGMRYLPDIDHFALFAAHGIDTGILNNLGYVSAEQLDPGQPVKAKLGEYGPIISVSPLDPLLKELGIRYLAFHSRPAAPVLSRLRPLIDGYVSEFWIYELK